MSDYENIQGYKLNEKKFITYIDNNIIYSNISDAKIHMIALYNNNYNHLFKNTVYIYIQNENDTENVFKYKVEYDTSIKDFVIEKMLVNQGLIKIKTLEPYILFKLQEFDQESEQVPVEYNSQTGGNLDNSHKLNDILNKILDKHYGNEINNYKNNITLPSPQLVEMVINDQYSDDCAKLIIEYIINIEEVFKLIKKIFNDDYIPKILKNYTLVKSIIIIILTKIYDYDYDLFFTKLVDLIFPWIENYM
jgi:hypothetical protein